MIPDFCLTEWRQNVPWVEDYQVEQDLIISRVLIALYQNPLVKTALAFRGSTALNKLYITPPSRYSEDIDLVQIQPESIGKTIDAIRSVLDSWLGEPVRKLTERSVKLVYRYQAQDNSRMRLKIEINTTEHFHVFDLVDHQFAVKNAWFSGEATLRTYQLNELMGTKLRALYQRRKGRDLFDLWMVLKNNLVNPETVLHVFQAHAKREKQVVTRAMFEKNLLDKLEHQDFKNDMNNLLANREDHDWSLEKACDLVSSQLIKSFPGEPLKIDKP